MIYENDFAATVIANNELLFQHIRDIMPQDEIPVSQGTYDFMKWANIDTTSFVPTNDKHIVLDDVIDPDLQLTTLQFATLRYLEDLKEFPKELTAEQFIEEAMKAAGEEQYHKYMMEKTLAGDDFAYQRTLDWIDGDIACHYDFSELDDHILLYKAEEDYPLGNYEVAVLRDNHIAIYTQDDYTLPDRRYRYDKENTLLIHNDDKAYLFTIDVNNENLTVIEFNSNSDEFEQFTYYDFDDTLNFNGYEIAIGPNIKDMIEMCCDGDFEVIKPEIKTNNELKPEEPKRTIKNKP